MMKKCIFSILAVLTVFAMLTAGCDTSSSPSKKDVAISIAAIPGVTAPVTGGTPVTKINDTAEYTGTVKWRAQGATTDLTGSFAIDTVYTATITLKPKTGFTTEGVAANFFKVDEATASNAANSGVVTAVFPQTGGTAEEPDVITEKAVPHIVAPVTGATPETTFSATQYNGAITWSPAPVDGKFVKDTAYTATITLTPKTGFTTEGVTANFGFTVTGAETVTNTAGTANSVVITAVFPKTGGSASEPSIISEKAIPGVTAPATGQAPVTSVTTATQYNIAVSWSPAVTGTFAASTVYTATITLTPKTGFTTTGVTANFGFTVASASTVTNTAGTAANVVVTAVFPTTGGSASQPVVITEKAIPGVTQPVTGEPPVTSVTTAAQYNIAVSWSPAVSGTFVKDQVYTATITLTPKAGFTTEGVAANFGFTVAGATTVTNTAGNATSVVVTAVFPATGAATSGYNVTFVTSGGVPTSIAAVNVAEGASLGTSFPKDPVKADTTDKWYEFDGWYVDNTKYTKDTVINAPTELTAKFTEKDRTFKVKFGTPDIAANTIDEKWNDAELESYPIAKILPSESNNETWNANPDTYGVAKLLWDEQYLYMYAKVTDPNVTGGSTSNQHLYDSVEFGLYENMESQTTTPTGNGYGTNLGGQYRVQCNGALSGITTNVTGFGWDVEGGYVVLIKLPWQQRSGDYFKQNDRKFGFEPHINACNPAGTRIASLRWRNTTDGIYNDRRAAESNVMVMYDGPEVTSKVNAQKPVITRQPTEPKPTLNLVIGSPINLSVEANSPDGGTLTYVWSRSQTIDGAAANNPTNASNEPGSFAYTPGSASDYYYYCTITNTIADNGDGGSKTATQVTERVHVITAAAVNAGAPTISAQPQNATYPAVDDIATALFVTAAKPTTYPSVTNDLTYQWWSSKVSGNDAGAEISGATNSTYIPSTAEEGVTWYWVVVTHNAADVAEVTGTKTASVTSSKAVIAVATEIPKSDNANIRGVSGLTNNPATGIFGLYVGGIPASANGDGGAAFTSATTGGAIASNATYGAIGRTVVVIVQDPDVSAVGFYAHNTASAPASEPADSAWISLKKTNLLDYTNDVEDTTNPDVTTTTTAGKRWVGVLDKAWATNNWVGYVRITAENGTTKKYYRYTLTVGSAVYGTVTALTIGEVNAFANRGTAVGWWNSTVAPTTVNSTSLTGTVSLSAMTPTTPGESTFKVVPSWVANSNNAGSYQYAVVTSGMWPLKEGDSASFTTYTGATSSTTPTISTPNPDLNLTLHVGDYIILRCNYPTSSSTITGHYIIKVVD